MTNLESGLLLPIRFYDTYEEQDRFKNQSVGVALTEQNYPYVDCKTLAPFQIVYAQMDYATSISWKLVCADTGAETSLTFTASEWQEYIDGDAQLVYTSYLGEGDFSSEAYNGLFYFEVTIVDAQAETRIFYSDLFMIDNCGETAYNVEEYRIWNSQTDIRAIDANDLRII